MIGSLSGLFTLACTLSLALASVHGSVTVGQHGGIEKQSASKKDKDHIEPEHQAVADAVNARRAADSAQVAAAVANKVASHTETVATLANHALDHAEDALRLARVDGKGLSRQQIDALRKSEHKVQNAMGVRSDREASTNAHMERDRLRSKLDSESGEEAKTDLEQMLEDLDVMADELREMREKRGETKPWDLEKKIEDLQNDIEELQDEESKMAPKDRPKSHDELKVEVERLREAVKQLKKQGGPVEVVHTIPAKGAGSYGSGIDVDTDLPYGELAPFGGENTAQELTDSSVEESNGMIDQIERAQVSEEKRSVFRALTRLRGSAIASFDGIARTQTSNIDEYNKKHKWRDAHPMHHLAEEEGDIQKWAFPEDADLMQTSKLAPNNRTNSSIHHKFALNNRTNSSIHHKSK